MENILDEAITPTRIKEILKQFKSNLVSCFLKKWENTLDKDTLDPQSSNVYRSVKSQFSCEYYLKFLRNPDLRSAVTKLRISSHSLPIEVGRYKKIPRNMRICPLCSSKALGDEFHYLLKCENTTLENTRDTFILKENIRDQF